jgi:Protein of unknown function (DUF998)
MQTKDFLSRNTAITKALLVCGVVAGPLFTAAWIVEGATRINYDPLRYPISSLSIGDGGWMQIATFIFTGLLILALAIGLRHALRSSGSVWGPALVGLAGIGLIGAGIFVADPLNGYPPGTPLIPTERTTHGILHDLFGIPFFLGLPITGFVFARLFARRGKRGWAAYSAISGFAMSAGFFFGTSEPSARLRGYGRIFRAFPAHHRHHRLGLADPARRLHADSSIGNTKRGW